VTPTQMYILQAVGGFCLPVDSSHITIPMCHLQTFCLFSPLVILLGRFCLVLHWLMWPVFQIKVGDIFYKKECLKVFLNLTPHFPF